MAGRTGARGGAESAEALPIAAAAREPSAAATDRPGSAKDSAASKADPSAPSSPEPTARLTEPPCPRTVRNCPEASRDAFTASYRASSQVSNSGSLPLLAEPPRACMQGAQEILLQRLLIGAGAGAAGHGGGACGGNDAETALNLGGAWVGRASQHRIVTSRCGMEPARPAWSHGLNQLYSPGRSFLLTVTRPTFWPEKRSSSSPEKL